jgi:hypothetical protein
MKYAKYRDSLFAGVDLINKDIRQSSDDPFSCTENAPWAARIRKMAQNVRCLAYAGTDTRGGAWTPLIDVLVNRQKL